MRSRSSRAEDSETTDQSWVSTTYKRQRTPARSRITDTYGDYEGTYSIDTTDGYTITDHDFRQPIETSTDAATSYLTVAADR